MTTEGLKLNICLSGEKRSFLNLKGRTFMLWFDIEVMGGCVKRY